MSIKSKILVTSGCSFSDTQHWTVHKTWPIHLQRSLGVENLYNEARGGQSNDLIGVRTIYRINKLLRDNKPEDIFVGIMWTGTDRRAFYLDKDHDEKTDKDWIDSHSWIDEDGEGVWKPLNIAHAFEDHTKSTSMERIYYNNIHTINGATSDTLHMINYVQNYLQRLGIRYFMTTSWNIFDDMVTFNEPYYRGQPEIYGDKTLSVSPRLNQNDLKWIRDLIDWNKFIPTEGMWEWLQSTYPSRDPHQNSHHPTEEENKLFTEKMIAPFINKLYE